MLERYIIGMNCPDVTRTLYTAVDVHIKCHVDSELELFFCLELKTKTGSG